MHVKGTRKRGVSSCLGCWQEHQSVKELLRMNWEIQATVNTEQGDSFFCSFWQLSIRGWAWNDSGAKSVGRQPMIRIASIQYGVGVDSDIWFDSNGLGLGNAHSGSWYKHTRQDDSSFHTAKKNHTKNQGFGNRGVSGFSYFGGDPFFLIFLLRGVLHRKVAPQEFFTCLFSPRPLLGTPGTARANNGVS
ncbi:hypothetical protein BDP81DRAFT_16140 [Colletotrichum phormii]|uniref:Uncharacterized protein n=1 Tax=Colletotrichum phormii TaxID=359342 RepID=A0AAJ0EK85_9PEZI|nr:uncharacterized protein BDP81DRAFT_16140 [Colletotrichum phormii]KAK1656145.1 hypothetical protein BDP81DRAFT_16140 [Colletotrichum phormii]